MDTNTSNDAAAARFAAFVAHSSARHAHGRRVPLEERLARAEAQRAVALENKIAAAAADVQRVHRKRARSEEEQGTNNEAAERLAARLAHAERRRAHALASRAHAAHVANERVKAVEARRAALHDGDGAASVDHASDSSDVEAPATPHRRTRGVVIDTAEDVEAGSGAASMEVDSPLSSPASCSSGNDSSCGGAYPSPPRQRRRQGSYAFGSNSAQSPHRNWYEAAASPKRSPRRAWRVVNRRMKNAAARRAQRRNERRLRAAQRKRRAAERVAAHKARQASALAHARLRLLQALDAATERREEHLAQVVRRSRTHSEDVAERVARVRTAKAKIAHLVKSNKARDMPGTTPQQSAAATTAQAAGATTTPAPAQPPQHSNDESKSAPHADSDAAKTGVEAVHQLVRGKTVQSMLRTLHRVVQRSTPTPDAAAGTTKHGEGNEEARFSFTRCTRVLQSRKVVLAFRGLAAVIIKATEELLAAETPPARRVSTRPPVQRSAKTLMASIMIAHYPEEMFDAAAIADASSVEAALVTAALSLVGGMRILGAVSHPDSTVPADVTAVAVRSVHAAWLEYMDKFAAWKAKDGKVLAAQMGPGFVQLELTRRMYASQLDELRREAHSAGDETQAQVEATQQLLAGVGSHLAVMRRQLTNLLGEQGALDWERDAIKRLDEQLGDEPLPAPPRVTFRNASNAGRRKGSGDSVDSTASSSSGSRPRVAPSSTLNAAQAANSPPRTVRMSTRRQGGARMMRNLMSNVSLVHKLMLNPEYRFANVSQPPCLHLDGWNAGASSPPDCTCANAPGANTGNRNATLSTCANHWQSVFAGAADNDELVNKVVAELRLVRTGLAELTPNRKDLAEELTRALDLQFIADNLRNGTYSSESFATLLEFLADRIAHLEAPERSDSTRAWAAAAAATIRTMPADASATMTLPQQLARVTAWLHFKLEQIRVDIINFQLSTLAPYLTTDGRGSEYERKKFEEARSRGELSLAGTVFWVRDVIEAEASASADRSAALTALRVNSQKDRMRLLTRGVVALLSRPVSLLRLAAEASAGTKPTPQQYYPETLRLDAEGLTATQNVLQRVALSASLVATVQQVLRQLGATTPKVASHPGVPPSSHAVSPTTIPQLRQALDDWLRADDMTLADLQEGVVTAALKMAELRGVTMAPEQVDTLRRAVDQAVSPSHPVFATYHRRALMVLADFVRTTLGVTDSTAVSGKQLDLARRSLTFALPELTTVAAQLSRLLSHNEATFTGHYRSLITGISTQLAKGDGGAGAGAGAGAVDGTGAGAGAGAGDDTSM